VRLPIGSSKSEVTRRHMPPRFFYKIRFCRLSGSQFRLCLPERREKGFVESWHTTAGKIGITALAHNETVLILDDATCRAHPGAGTGGPRYLVWVGLGTERDRLTNPGSVRRWRLYFLSTSNYSLAELADRGDMEIDDAQRGRFVGR